MYILSPAAVQLRELRRQALLNTVARERLATAASGSTPPDTVTVSPDSVAASRRSVIVSRLSLVGWLARVAMTTGRPLSRSSLWS